MLTDLDSTCLAMGGTDLNGRPWVRPQDSIDQKPIIVFIIHEAPTYQRILHRDATDTRHTTCTTDVQTQTQIRSSRPRT